MDNKFHATNTRVHQRWDLHVEQAALPTCYSRIFMILTLLYVVLPSKRHSVTQ